MEKVIKICPAIFYHPESFGRLWIAEEELPGWRCWVTVPVPARLPAVASHCLRASGSAAAAAAPRAPAEPWPGGDGEHGPGGWIMEQNADSMQVCESWSRASERCGRGEEWKASRQIVVFVWFPFSHKSRPRPNQLAEIISIPKSLPSLNIDLKNIFFLYPLIW